MRLHAASLYRKAQRGKLHKNIQGKRINLNVCLKVKTLKRKMFYKHAVLNNNDIIAEV